MPSKNSSMDLLVDQYHNYLLIEKGLSRTTLESYSRDIARYQKFLQKNDCFCFSETDVLQTILWLLLLLTGSDKYGGVRSKIDLATPQEPKNAILLLSITLSKTCVRAEKRTSPSKGLS